jgi:hypothetical protein
MAANMAQAEAQLQPNSYIKTQTGRGFLDENQFVSST